MTLIPQERKKVISVSVDDLKRSGAIEAVALKLFDAILDYLIGVEVGKVDVPIHNAAACSTETLR